MRSDAVGGRALAIDANYDGRVCMLAVCGELDVLAVDDFLASTAEAVADTARLGAGRAERLVLDLAGLAFLDCAGAHALELATRAAPDECTVIVRSLSPAARRVLDLVGVNLEYRRPKLAPERTGAEVARSQMLRAAASEMMSRVAEVAAAMAATEDSLAATMTRIASQHPDHAAHLTVLSAQARSYAAHIRRWMDNPALRAERMPGGLGC